MFDIENEIKNNLAYFNDQEPDEKHQARFTKRLGGNISASSKKISIQSKFSIAAAFLFLIATSYLILETLNLQNTSSQLYVTDIIYTPELYNVQSYYDDMSASQLNTIDEYVKSEEEGKRVMAIAKRRMDKLDANLARIEKEYVKNPQNEQLKAAIVVNKKMKAQVAKNIVENLDNAQKGYHAGSMITNY